MSFVNSDYEKIQKNPKLPFLGGGLLMSADFHRLIANEYESGNMVFVMRPTWCTKTEI